MQHKYYSNCKHLACVFFDNVQYHVTFVMILIRVFLQNDSDTKRKNDIQTHMASMAGDILK